MFCPNCSQEQISTETKFCSRCGFLMTGVIELVKNGGETASKSLMEKISGDSPRKRGVKQGIFIFSLSFLIVPIVAIITIASRSEPFVVAITLVLMAVGGLLRMVYALLLQSGEPRAGKTTIGTDEIVVSGKSAPKELSDASAESVSAFIAPGQVDRRDTKDLVQTSVTEETTKLLKIEEMEN